MPLQWGREGYKADIDVNSEGVHTRFQRETKTRRNWGICSIFWRRIWLSCPENLSEGEKVVDYVFCKTPRHDSIVATEWLPLHALSQIHGGLGRKIRKSSLERKGI